MEMNAQPAENQSEPKISVLEKLGLIFTNPVKVFKNITFFPDWITPIVLIIVFSIASSFFVYDLQIDAQEKKILSNENIPEQQKEIIAERFDEARNSDTRMIQPIIGIIIFIFGSFALVAGVFLVTGKYILGGEADFKTLLAVYGWGYLVAIPESIIKIPLMLAKNSIHVYTSLAILFDPSEADTILFKIANAVDVFSLWRVVLWAIGFGIVFKFSQGRSYTVVGVLYVIYIAIYIGFSTLTGGMFG